jgi:hypothetical protein
MATGKQIWEEIKVKDIDVFAMTSKVEQYCEFVDIDPTKCYLTCKATAALPALETALGEKFTCTMVDKYVVVEKK